MIEPKTDDLWVFLKKEKYTKNTIDRNSNFSYLFQGKQGIPYY